MISGSCDNLEVNPVKPLVVLVCAGAVFAQTPATKPKPAATPAKPAAVSAAKPAGTTAKAAPGVVKAAPAKPVAAAPKDGKVVITVGNETVTDKEFEALIDTLPDQLKAQARMGRKKEIAEQVARVKMLAQEARRMGLDKDPQYATRIQFQVENMLAGAVYNEMQKKATVDDADLKKRYEEAKAGAEEVNARHILIRAKGSPSPLGTGKKELTEEEALAKAQDLRKKILAGEDFAEVAKKESDDPGSANVGGDLGSFRHGQMVPAFEQTAFSLPAGQVSEPVKTQFGYHLIKVEKHTTKTYEEMKPDLEKSVRPEAAGKAVDALRSKTDVKFDDAYFGPPASVNPAGAPPAGAPPASQKPQGQ